MHAMKKTALILAAAGCTAGLAVVGSEIDRSPHAHSAVAQGIDLSRLNPDNPVMACFAENMPVPTRFAASIEIDRSALPPGLAVETAFALGEVGSLGQEFILTHPDAKLLWHDSPTYDFTLESGSWSARCIPHAATAPGSRVPSLGAAFEPELLTPNTPNVTCRLFVDDPIRTASLRVTGTDASGEPARVQVEILRDAGGRVRADGLRWSQPGTPIEIPVERRRNSVLGVVRGEGHEARGARLNAGSSHEITMLRGNTEPVFVVDATHGAPAVGVDVWINGSSIGPTDERGIALFRGTAIPVDFEGDNRLFVVPVANIVAVFRKADA